VLDAALEVAALEVAVLPVPGVLLGLCVVVVVVVVVAAAWLPLGEPEAGAGLVGPLEQAAAQSTKAAAAKAGRHLIERGYGARLCPV
jgi:hypothetical protein